MARKEEKNSLPEYNTNNLNSNYINTISNVNSMNNIGTNVNNQNINLKNADVVFDDNAHLTFKEKIVDFVRSLNKKMVALVSGIIFVILF